MAIIKDDPIAGVYKKLVFSADGTRLQGGILVGDAADYQVRCFSGNSRDWCYPEASAAATWSPSLSATSSFRSYIRVCLLSSWPHCAWTGRCFWV